jgi:hypothetical protein
MYNIDLLYYKYKQYYEKHVTLRGGHIIGMRDKRRKLRR